MGNTTFNKSPLAAQKKSCVFSKLPFPFITYWVSKRVSKIGHRRVILNARRLWWTITVQTDRCSYLRKEMASVFILALEWTSHYADCWGCWRLAINTCHCLFRSDCTVERRQRFPILPFYSIYLWVEKQDNDRDWGAFERRHSSRFQSIGRIMRRTDLRE